MLSAYFGFQKEPFASVPDPEFVYNHTAFENIGAGLTFFELSHGKGLFLIVGAPGTGKSVLLSSILNQNRARDCCAYLVCREDQSFAALLEAWCGRIGIDPATPDPEVRLQAVCDYLKQRADEGATPALLLDDAEKLPDDTLLRICEIGRIDSGSSRPFRIVLAARPEIDSRLRQPNLQSVAQQITCRCSLEPLSREEVGQYIQHQLSVAGNRGPEPFSSEAIDEIAEASGGVPAAINALCDTALQLAELQRQGTVSTAIVEQAIRGCVGSAGEDPGARIAAVPEDPPVAEEPEPEPSGLHLSLVHEEPARPDDPQPRPEIAWVEAEPVPSTELTAATVDPPASHAPAPAAIAPEPSHVAGSIGARSIGAGSNGAALTGMRDRQWPTPMDVHADEMAAAWSGRDPGSAVAARKAGQGRIWLMAGVAAVGLLVGGGIALYQFQSDRIAAVWMTSPKAPEQTREFTGLPEAVQEGTRQPAAVAESAETPKQPNPPRLTVANAKGREDEGIPLDIKASLTGTGDSDKLAIFLAGLPENARLSAGEQSEEGVWRLTEDQLKDLKLLPPANLSGEFELKVTASAVGTKQAEGATASESMKVAVSSVADPPSLVVQDATGSHDQPIPIDIKAALGDGDGSESLSIILSGLPKGAELSSGRTDASGAWRLTEKQLSDLWLLPPPRYSGEFRLTAGAIALEKDGSSATTTRSLKVTVAADAPAAPSAGSEVKAEVPSVQVPAVPATAADAPAEPAATQLAARAPVDPKLEKWMGRGDGLLKLGDLAAARLFYELALDQGHGPAATAIGKTYDPLQLRLLGIKNAPADRDMAISWYKRGMEAGDGAAETLLKSLTR